ncbi:MAG: SLATT domain-containing protein [Anaerolineales bacterium]|nr:SLATT domain-containing protein [Anaerolineales bacterium]
MDIQPQKITPILEIAWIRYSQLDAISKKRTKAHMRIRRWIAIFSVLATFFAILSTYFPFPADPSALSGYAILGGTIRFLLILCPIVGSILASFTNKFFSNGDWLITRAGAEEILKEIYTYRTILKDETNRRLWLEKRLAEIQRSVFRGMNGELTIEAYDGPIPPNYSPNNPYEDSGFHDLTGDEYFTYRLEAQLAWHVDRVNKRHAERTRLQWFILLAGGAGAILAAVLPLWAALSASFVAIFIGWQELRNLDAVVRNYSKVIIELNILFDHWKNLESEEQTSTEFFKVVQSTEDILWSQNVEYIKAMQEALKESDLSEEAGLVNRVIEEARASDLRVKQAMRDSIETYTMETLHEAEEIVIETFETALRGLAEEASSDLVQAEFAAMQDAVTDVVENISERLGMSSILKAIQEEFEGVDIDSSTPTSILNDLMSRYPKTADPKG